MSDRRCALRCLWAGLLCAAAAAAGAHENHEHTGRQAAPPAVTPSPAQVRLADARLLDQHGRTLHLGREVIGEHIVIVDFVYTSCTTVCPVLSALMASLQPELGPEVRLVSITVDPVRDTPARLKAQADRHEAGPAWTWLTGTPSTVREVLGGFGASVADPVRHQPMVLVGDGRSGSWTRFVGLPDPQRLLARVAELQRARGASLAAAGAGR